MINLLSKFYRNFMFKRAIKSGLTVGEGCIFYGVPNFGTEPYLIKIGNNVEITSDVTFLTHDGSISVVRRLFPRDHMNKYGKIIIEDNCFIGTKAIILPNVSIGKNSIIGTGSIVTKDVPPNSVVAGNPARVICSIKEYADKVIDNTILEKGHSINDLRDYFWKEE